MSYPNQRSYPSKIPSPWLLLSEQEIAEYLIRHPEVNRAGSEKVLRMLAWLDQTFGPGREISP